MIVSYLTIATSTKRGRGVFTTKNIPANTVIEISPVIVLSAKDRAVIEKTKLHDYIFEWGTSKKKGCVALGYVSLYNHDYEANCEYDMDYKKETITITTVKKIKKGEELFVNYNAKPDDKTKVWFNAK
jgi:SET domain-containing protein